MTLATWLDAHIEPLISAATTALSRNEALMSQAVEVVVVFYETLLRATQSRDPEPLYDVLAGWVAARSTPTDDDPIVLTVALARIKDVTMTFIYEQADKAEAAQLLLEADRLFTDALLYLARIEAERQVGHMRQRLQTAQHKLERLDKSKSDFIAIAAHELKTPLTVCEGYVGILRTMASEDADVRAMLEGVEGGLRRLREIVSDIIDVAMIELKMVKLRYQLVWLHHLLNALERDVARTAEERSISLTIERETVPTLPTFADPDRLLVVLLKVVMNAIKYTDDGGQVRITARELPGFVDLMVIDNGIGIAPRDLHRIFDAFSSSGDVMLHSSGKTKFKGAGPGLGLPIAKGFIEAHGGSIWAQSAGQNETEHPGSTFHVLIPMRDAPPEESVIDLSYAS